MPLSPAAANVNEADTNPDLTPEQSIIADLKNRNIAGLASVIRKDWKNIYFGARPYLDAMFSLNTVKDNYLYDSGESIIIHFLCNANTWRGPVAKAVKAELKRRCKIK